ncbi:MAG: phage tail protein [Bacteroidetes bacterium]|nr:MAG: phage tail protein [Bacteroidota bacterium]
MESFFIAQVCLFAGNFAPRGWAFCDGSLLPISSYEALFSLVGTTYGGDGRTTFGLPDFRGRIPVGTGQGPGLSNIPLGGKSGIATQTFTAAHLPTHTHTATGAIGSTTQSGTTANPGGAVVAQANNNFFAPATPAAGTLGSVAATVQPAGGTTGFDNHMPSLGIYFIIALEGIYPSRF